MIWRKFLQYHLLVDPCELYCCIWVPIIILFFSGEAPFRGFIHLQRVGSWLLNFHCEICSFSFKIKIRLIDIRSVIIYFGNRHASEFPAEIKIRHEENSICPLVEIANPFFLWFRNLFPNRITVWPSTSIFSLSPGISKLNNLFSPVVDFDFSSIQESESMALYYPILTLCPVTTWVRCGYHRKIAHWRSYKLLPLFFRILVQKNILDGRSSQVMKRLFWESILNLPVGSINLGPSLFKDHDP